MSELIKTPVFVGLTRPAMTAGVPLKALILEAVFVCFLFGITGNPFIIATGVPLHGVLMWITSKDIDLFSDFVLLQNTASMNPKMNKYWGHISLAPMEFNDGNHK